MLGVTQSYIKIYLIGMWWFNHWTYLIIIIKLVITKRRILAGKEEQP